MLGSVPADDVTIVADLEAGIGTLTRLADAAVDVTLVVVEPTPRSMDVARRAVDVATERGQGRIIIVANKIATDDDFVRIQTEFEGHTVVAVPSDNIVDQADRQGCSPVDLDAQAPAVKAIELLAASL